MPFTYFARWGLLIIHAVNIYVNKDKYHTGNNYLYILSSLAPSLFPNNTKIRSISYQLPSVMENKNPPFKTTKLHRTGRYPWWTQNNYLGFSGGSSPRFKPFGSSGDLPGGSTVFFWYRDVNPEVLGVVLVPPRYVHIYLYTYKSISRGKFSSLAVNIEMKPLREGQRFPSKNRDYSLLEHIS